METRYLTDVPAGRISSGAEGVSKQCALHHPLCRQPLWCRQAPEALLGGAKRLPPLACRVITAQTQNEQTARRRGQLAASTAVDAAVAAAPAPWPAGCSSRSLAGWLLCRGWPLAADPWPVPAGQESTVSALLRTGRSHRQRRQRAPAAEPAALCHQQARHSERWQQKQQHLVALVALRAARQQRGQPAQILVPQAAKNDIHAHHYRWAGGWRGALLNNGRPRTAQGRHIEKIQYRNKITHKLGGLLPGSLTMDHL
jgi:hypothetical protein